MTYGTTKPNVRLAWNYKPRKSIGGVTAYTAIEPYIIELDRMYDFRILTKQDETWLTALKALNEDKPVIQYVLFVEIRDGGTTSNNWTLGSSSNWNLVASNPDCWEHMPATTNADVDAGATVITVGDITKVQTPTSGGGIADVNGTPVRFTGVSGSTITGCTKLTGGALEDIPPGVLKCRIKSSVSGTFYLMNPGNATMRAWCKSNIEAYWTSYPAWDGLFLDNCDLNGGRNPTGFPTAEHSTEALWVDDLHAFAAWIRANISTADKPLLYGNLYGWSDSTSDLEAASLISDAAYLQSLDGGMFEEWPLNGSAQYPSAARLVNQFERVESALAAGGDMYLICQSDGDYNNGATFTAKAKFAFCAYMCIWQPGLMFRVSNYDNSTLTRSAYPEHWPFDFYHKKFGQPIDAGSGTSRYLVGNEWRRDFEFGQVRVDPVAQTSSYTLTTR